METLDTGRKIRPAPAVLGYEMPHYDEARLGRLLRLLRAAPIEWVRRAQRIPLKSVRLTAPDLEQLGRTLERDPSFRREFDADPVAAVRTAGMPELGLRLEYEIGELIALAERVARDADRRKVLVAALSTESSPKSVLQLLSESEVEAHALQPQPLEDRALLLALASTAVADKLRAALNRT